MKKLFLAHYSSDIPEIEALAAELRLHGIAPWVDKQGGFAVADDSEQEARRAIREDCFGLLLYATQPVFDRWFIREVEIDEARKVRELNPGFSLFAVPCRISFKDLAEQSQNSFGIDLSRFHTVAISEHTDLMKVHRQIAAEVLRKSLQTTRPQDTGCLSLQFSTRELMPDETQDVLRIDATRLFAEGVSVPANWIRVLLALQDVKTQIAQMYGRPTLRVNGSKHLSAAFMFGRVFARFQLQIRQTADQVWSTDAEPASHPPLVVNVIQNRTALLREHLAVEIASGFKNVAASVDDFTTQTGFTPSIRLQLKPSHPPLTLDNRSCITAVEQTYLELERVLQTYHGIQQIHIFAAVPQSFMMLLGRLLKGMPATQLYEWNGHSYVPSCYIPGGVL